MNLVDIDGNFFLHSDHHSRSRARKPFRFTGVVLFVQVSYCSWKVTITDGSDLTSISYASLTSEIWLIAALTAPSVKSAPDTPCRTNCSWSAIRSAFRANSRLIDCSTSGTDREMTANRNAISSV